MQNVVGRTVVSQYQNSPKILALVKSFNEWIDPSVDFDTFYNLIWNIDTAVGYGLDVWGRIVNVSRVVETTGTPDYLGFQGGGTEVKPFGFAPFYTGTLVTENYTLLDDAYRTLILVKAAANICAATAPALNAMLAQLFPEGRSYVNDYGAMQMRYMFEFALKDDEVSILESAGVIPIPTGVTAFFMQLPPASRFGFAEAGSRYSRPFGHGTFFSSTELVVIASQEA